MTSRDFVECVFFFVFFSFFFLENGHEVHRTTQECRSLYLGYEAQGVTVYKFGQGLYINRYL